MKTINTDKFSSSLRARSLDLEEQRILVTNFNGSAQEEDLTEPANCNGFGRIRHFRRSTSEGWPENPLPIDPASRALGLNHPEMLQAQVFQNAACNWRCWYCFVDFELLSADPRRAAYLSANELLDLYLSESQPPRVIDLTGGQPDLVPEWIPWMMRALKDRGLERDIYLWSDDNLSNDYFWRYLSVQQKELVRTNPMYGRVCCFKGFNSESFQYNTAADASIYDRQFELFGKLLGLGLDIYAYTTFTSPSVERLEAHMARFVDRLQQIHENLPLRTVPLEIKVFNPVTARMNKTHELALANQWTATEAWQTELSKRFRSRELECNIADVALG